MLICCFPSRFFCLFRLIRRAEESKRLSDAASEILRLKSEEELMSKGMKMFKLGSYGDPKLTKISLDNITGDWFISWESKRKAAVGKETHMHTHTGHKKETKEKND